MSYEKIRCEYCGRFIGDDDLNTRDAVGSREVWSLGPQPDLEYVVWWHRACLEEKRDSDARIKKETEGR